MARMLLPFSPLSLSRRRGQMAPLLIFLLTVLLAAFAVAVNLGRLWAVRVELQGATDSGCLAAAQVLVDDDLLRNDLNALSPLLDRARAEANTFAQANPVSGQLFSLDPNPSNLPDGDILFGTLDNPLSKVFTPTDGVNNPAVTALPLIDAVRVRGVLSSARGNAPGLIFGNVTGIGNADVQTASTVMHDRDVVGFLPLWQQPLQIAPLALLADYTATNSSSWQYQVDSRQGQDQLTFDRTNQTFVAGPDGLFEFQAVLATNSNQLAQANVQLLYIGTSDVNGLCTQLLNGVTVTQLANLGGQFVLDAATNHLAVSGAQIGPANPSADLTQLYNTLVSLQQSAVAAHLAAAGQL